MTSSIYVQTMERYGFLRKTSDTNDISSMHETLFPDIKNCVREGVLQQQDLQNTIYYFKILNNREIIQYMHASPGDTELFSYFHLHQTCPTDGYVMCAAGDQLYARLIDCVFTAKWKPTDLKNAATIKVAYYKLLTDDELLKALHRR